MASHMQDPIQQTEENSFKEGEKELGKTIANK